ncbi:hypothetical protein IMZ11_10150 [Microtetraspora sp. AC03309]|uniref:hypothetical protein n=1 Tax=Microtetraspora sp. AC03309 TaxID=2779376 RepID=UPI001E2F5976|nr:hypothetical protein [Microtetraspora sp. AC03309]MCC5576000.1 hypothetical protein [Microtetraspora sp. AC03309]
MADLPPITQVAAGSASYTLRRVYLNVRLASRVACVVMAVVMGTLPPAVACAAGAACCAYDVAAFLYFRRGGRIRLGYRLALDAADVSAWAVTLGHPVDAPALLAAPLAAEAVIERGVAAVLVPLVVGGVTTLVLRLGGRPESLAPFVWPAFGLAQGLLLSRYLQRRVRRRLRTAAAEREAAYSQAVLAGRNSVAVGADTIVDVLTRTWPLLAVTGRPVGSPLAAWRHRLAEETAGHAEYLRTALLRWEQRHNAAGPDLSRDVEFPATPDGGLLLSPAQVAELGTSLDAMDLSGTAEVAVVRAAPLGGEQVLRVAGRRVVLPADGRAAVPPLDLGPPVIAIGGVGSLAHSWPDMDRVPLAATIPLALLAFCLAYWAHALIVRRGAAAHAPVLAAALAYGGLDATVSTALLGNVTAGGLTRLPFLHFLLWTGPLTAMYLRDLTMHRRVAALAFLLLVLGGCAWLLPHSVSVADLSTLVWPLAFTVGASGLRDLLDRDTGAFANSVADAHDAAAAAGFLAGRADVLRLVEDAGREASERLAADRDLLDPVFLPEIERRLALVNHRLIALRSG